MTADRGFTLIEALVILTMIGVGMLLFLRSSILAMGFHERGRMMSEALLLAQGRLELLEARGWEEAVRDCVAEGASRYRREVALRGKRYRLLLERRRLSTTLHHFTVTCFWEGPAGAFVRESSVSLSSARNLLP